MATSAEIRQQLVAALRALRSDLMGPCWEDISATSADTQQIGLTL